MKKLSNQFNEKSFFDDFEDKMKAYEEKMLKGNHPDMYLLFYVGNPFLIDENYPEAILLYRMNKIFQHRFKNEAKPFRILVDKSKLHSSPNKFESKNINDEYTCRADLLFVQLINIKNEIAHVYPSVVLPFWYRDILDSKQLLEKAKQTLLNINKNMFKNHMGLKGSHLLKFIQGKLWEISPNLNVKPKWENMYLLIKDIDFRIHVYNFDQWIFDVTVENNKTTIQESCYYQGTCGEISKESQISVISPVEEIIHEYLKKESGDLLNKIWDPENTVYDVMVVIQGILNHKFSGSIFTLYSPLINNSLREVYDKWPTNDVVLDEKQNYDTSVIIITPYGEKPIFNLRTETGILNDTQIVALAIANLVQLVIPNWLHNADNSYEIKDFIDRVLTSVSLKFSTKPFWNNLYLAPKDIDFKIHVYLNNEWKFDFQMDFKNKIWKIYSKCFYDKLCDIEEYPLYF